MTAEKSRKGVFGRTCGAGLAPRPALHFQRAAKPLHPRDLCATITAVGWERYWVVTRPIRVFGLVN